MKFERIVWPPRLSCESAKWESAEPLPWRRDRSCSPASFPPAGCSNTSLKRWINALNEGKVGLSSLHTAVAQSSALPVRSEHTNAMRLSSVGYSMVCWLTNIEHWSKKPLHLVGDPSNFSGKARRGLAVVSGACWKWTGGEAEALDAWRWSACKVFTSSSVTEVSRLSCCWCVARTDALAETSVWSGRMLLDRSLAKSSVTRISGVGSMCSLLKQNANQQAEFNHELQTQRDRAESKLEFGLKIRAGGKHSG